MSRKRPVRLSGGERERLEGLVRRGRAQAREYTRARILLLSDKGWSDADIASALSCHETTVARVRRRFVSRGLDHALHDGERSGRRRALTDEQLTTLLELADSPPPEGAGRWSARALAEALVARGTVEAISPETVRKALQRARPDPD